MRPADQDAVVVARALGEELAEPRVAVPDHHLDGARQLGVDSLPLVVGEAGRVEGDEVAERVECTHQLDRARMARAMGAVRHPIIQVQDAQPSCVGPPARGPPCAGAEIVVVFGRRLRLEPGAVLGEEARASFTLHLERVRPRGGAGEFEVQRHRRRLVHHAPTRLPHPHAVVGVLVVGGLKLIIEAAQRLEQPPRRQQEGARAVVDVTAKGVHGRERRIAAPVARSGAIPPQDAARLLEPSVEEDQLAAHRPDVGRAGERGERRVDAARQELGVVVEEEEVLAASHLGRLVDRAQEAAILRVADHGHAVQPLEQGARLVLGGVVDQHQLEARSRLFERTQAAQGQLGAVVEDHDHRHARQLVRVEAELRVRRQKVRQEGARERGEAGLERGGRMVWTAHRRAGRAHHLGGRPAHGP